MRFLLLLAALTCCFNVFAQITGQETVTYQNATSLGFTFELKNVNTGVRVRITVPETIHNGFTYAYTGLRINDVDGNLIMSIRPESHDEIYSKSKMVQFVVPIEVLPCTRVTATYLNPERPMHSDYLMRLDLASFTGGNPSACSFINDFSGTQ